MPGRRRKEQDDPFDPYELGSRRSDPTLGALEPIPELLPARLHPRKLLLYFVAGVVLIAVLRDGVGRGAPVATGSCTQPAFTLSASEVRSYGVLRWSASGPDGASVLFAVDTDQVPAGSSDRTLAGPLPFKDCAASGQFGMRVPEGEHVVTVFALAADGTATTLGTQKVYVTAP